jgi:hypothetical protein
LVALVVEDGTGKADAESYVSVDDANAYATAHGLTFPASPLAPAEQALRRATAFIDAHYRNRFPGQRKNGRGQALEWPRSYACDKDGNVIADDEIPVEIVNATIEAAVREMAVPGSLNPDVTPGKVKKSASVGDIAVEYAVGTGSAYEQRPVVGVIDGILSSLLGSTSPYFASAVRG